MILQHPGEPLASPHFWQITASPLQQSAEPLAWPHFAQSKTSCLVPLDSLQHPGEPLTSPHFEQIAAPSTQHLSVPLIWPHFAQIFGAEAMICPFVFSFVLASQPTPTNAAARAAIKNNTEIRFMFILLRIFYFFASVGGPTVPGDHSSRSFIGAAIQIYPCHVEWMAC